MGCSASSHAGLLVGGAGGLNSVTNDEDDTSWSPRSVSADIARKEQRQERCNDGRSKGCHHREEASSSSSGSGPATCPGQDDHCGGTLAPMGCSTDNGSSPERCPFPTNDNSYNNQENGQGPVENALNECCEPPLPSLNDSLSSWNNSIIDDTLPIHHHPHQYQRPSNQHDVTDSPGSAAHPAFSNRRWLVLPEHQYDMNTLHPPLPPFLGSMYWTAASPVPALQERGRLNASGMQIGERMRPRGDNIRHVPSLITDSPLVLHSPDKESCTLFGIQEESRRGVHSHLPLTPHSQHEDDLTKIRADKLLLSLNSTEEWDSETTSVSSSNNGERDDGDLGTEDCDDLELMNQFSPRTSFDISRELLDYSALDESYDVPQRRHQSPRRLFNDCDSADSGDDMIMEENPMNISFEVVANTPSRRHTNIIQQKTRTRSRSFQSMLCMAPSAFAIIDENDAPNTPREVKYLHSTPPALPKTPTPSSPNVATFYGHWGSRRERHVSTLPSPNTGEPIRLRVTESGLSGGHTNRSITPSASRIGHSMSSHTYNSSPCGDFFSYDPYFSTGKYTITLPNGKPYGNGLVMKMGWQFMILEDSRGAVLAVIKSRHTHTPSTVVYAPKARFKGQVASGHRLTRQATGNGSKKSAAVVVDGNNNCMLAEAGIDEALYPWALICKEGRTMEDDCTVHLVNDDVSGVGRGKSGAFRSKASFRGRHGFDRELRTHTVVSRTSSVNVNGGAGGGGGSSICIEEAKAPCCVIVRDPSNLDAVDITIAPGIDPLLMICYLASHSKMDVEPIMSEY